ncbi:DUF1804 family protein, partial [Limnobaculum xujianqingii]
MAHPRETRDRLRRSYVFDGLSMEIAAAQLSVSFATARRWKKDALDKGDDWEKQKSAHMMAGGGLEDVSRSLLSNMVIQFKSTMEAINGFDMSVIEPEKQMPLLAKRVEMLASLADAYNKSISASKRLLPETSQLALSLEVLQKLGVFISE